MERNYPQDLEAAIAFHGHMCPGLAIGYRAVKAALGKLQAQRPQDEELVAVVESDGCGIDAVQSLLGCTLGKGNLIYRDHGKQVYTVICRKRHRAVRIALRGDVLKRKADEEALLQKVLADRATDSERQDFQDLQARRTETVLHMEEGSLFKIEEVTPEVPEKARIFKSVTCRFCGEQVMEPRARLRDGKIACIPCAESYSRGW